jgi:hypothetical protein
MSGYAIKMIDANGEEDWVCVGFSDRIAIFPSQARAQEQADFIEMGLDEGERLYVVKAPRRGPGERP